MGATDLSHLATPVDFIAAEHPAVPTNGSLAESMERLVALAATALRCPLVFAILSGEDRRCFAAGSHRPAWLAHDPGAIRRSGLADAVESSPDVVAIHDLLAEPAFWGNAELAAIEIRSVIASPILAPDGIALGAIYAADISPMAWSDDDADMLRKFAATAASDIELRRSLAERDALARQLHFDARRDPLTGLANRAVLIEELRNALARSRSHAGDPTAPDGEPAADHVSRQDDLVGVILLDINNFRAINQRYGHQVGDQVLTSLGRRLQRAAGPGALIARLGGDDFAVLVDRIQSPEAAEELAARCRDALALPTVINGERIQLTASAGLSLSTIAEEIPEFMLRGADVAMTQAKQHAQAGTPSSPILFDWRISSDTRSRRRLEDELHRAVLAGEFQLHYLPTVSLLTGGITGAEALLRWQHPTRGLLAPTDFLGVAEELDIILDIGRWVLRQACRQVATWSSTREGHAPLSIAVNLSSRQFTSAALIDDVDTAVREFALMPASLALEVNERAVARDVSRAAGALAGLKSLGVRIHLDDFGAGNSPLGYLQRLPLDVVKIDHTLVGRMDRDEKARLLVRSVVGLARELRLDVIAEGIGSGAHLKALQELGCTHGQGALFSQATTAEGMTSMLEVRPW